MTGKVHYRRQTNKKLTPRGKCLKHLLLSQILLMPKRSLKDRYSERATFLSKSKATPITLGAAPKPHLKSKAFWTKAAPPITVSPGSRAKA